MMLTKSIKLSREDAIRLSYIVKTDPRVKRGYSEAIRICYEDVASNIPQWKNVLERAKSLDYSADLDTSKESSTISFLVESEVYMQVLDSVRKQLEFQRPRSSYITRLCLLATSLKLSTDSTNEKIEKQTEIDPRMYNASPPYGDKSSINREIYTEKKSDELLEDFKNLNLDKKLEAIYKKLLELERRA